MTNRNTVTRWSCIARYARMLGERLRGAGIPARDPCVRSQRSRYGRVRQECLTYVRDPRAGSVLMETVIAIPLFVILVGGTMWIGDLIYTKQKLVVSDRYAAWNAGNRHRQDKLGIQQEIQDNLFVPRMVGKQDVAKIEYAMGPADYWSTPFGATIHLELTMPVWTKNWLMAGVAWGNTSPFPYPRKVTFTGRDPDAATPPVHAALLMRTLYGTRAHRTWDPIALADKSRPWDKEIYKDEWPEIGELGPVEPKDLTYVPPLPDPPEGYEHDRHRAYRDWSE